VELAVAEDLAEGGTFDLVEAVEVELADEAGQFVVFEVLGKDAFFESLHVFYIEGVALLRPVQPPDEASFSKSV